MVDNQNSHSHTRRVVLPDRRAVYQNHSLAPCREAAANERHQHRQNAREGQGFHPVRDRGARLRAHDYPDREGKNHALHRVEVAEDEMKRHGERCGEEKLALRGGGGDVGRNPQEFVSSAARAWGRPRFPERSPENPRWSSGRRRAGSGRRTHRLCPGCPRCAGARARRCRPDSRASPRRERRVDDGDAQNQQGQASRKSNGPRATSLVANTPMIAPTEPARAKETLVLMSIRLWR